MSCSEQFHIEPANCKIKW